MMPLDLSRYVGLSFGEGPGAVTCWGLVRRVYADCLGVELPSYGEISARDLIQVARAFAAGQAAEPWRAVCGAPRVLDVVLMRGPRGGHHVVHVGVMVDQARLLHAEAATGAVVVPTRHISVAGRITGYRRWRPYSAAAPDQA